MIANFYCRLIKNDAENFQVFNFHGYKFIKFTNIISIKMYLENLDEEIIDKELPFKIVSQNKTKNVDSSKIGYSIIIGNNKLKYFKSCDIRYTRITEYPEDGILKYSFRYESNYKSKSASFTISDQVKLPYYINFPQKIAGNNDFISQLKNIESVVEGYTRDQIVGVIESMFN